MLVIQTLFNERSSNFDYLLILKCSFQWLGLFLNFVSFQSEVYHQDIQSWKMAKGKEVKEDERTFIVRMEKVGTTISKIIEQTKRPRRTVATILRKYRLRWNVFQTAKRSCSPPKTTSRDHHLWYGVACLMIELLHSPLLMAVSLVQSTVAFCRNISYH